MEARPKVNGGKFALNSTASLPMDETEGSYVIAQQSKQVGGDVLPPSGDCGHEGASRIGENDCATRPNPTSKPSKGNCDRRPSR
jgi:hypothetical protein